MKVLNNKYSEATQIMDNNDAIIMKFVSLIGMLIKLNSSSKTNQLNVIPVKPCEN